MTERVLRLSTAAVRLTVSEDTLKRWIRAGKIRGIRLPGGHWRIPETEVRRCLENITTAN